MVREERVRLKLMKSSEACYGLSSAAWHGRFRPGRRLGVGGCEDNRKEAAFHIRRFLDDGHFLELIGYAVEDGAADLGEHHLPAAEHDRYLDLVATLEEFLGRLCLHLEV